MSSQAQAPTVLPQSLAQVVPTTPPRGEATTLRDLTFPLIGGGMAILRVPLPLTEANFNLMMSMLGTMKDAITTPAP